MHSKEENSSRSSSTKLLLLLYTKADGRAFSQDAQHNVKEYKEGKSFKMSLKFPERTVDYNTKLPTWRGRCFWNKGLIYFMNGAIFDLMFKANHFFFLIQTFHI
jgi:hypothetical protein